MKRVPGFTLLEILLALAFGVVVIVLTLYLVTLGNKVSGELAVTEKSKYNEAAFLALIEKDFMEAEAVVYTNDGFKCIKSADSGVHYVHFDSLLIRHYVHLADSIRVQSMRFQNHKETGLIESINMDIKYNGELFPYVVGKHYSSTELIDYAEQQ